MSTKPAKPAEPRIEGLALGVFGPIVQGFKIEKGLRESEAMLRGNSLERDGNATSADTASPPASFCSAREGRERVGADSAPGAVDSEVKLPAGEDAEKRPTIMKKASRYLGLKVSNALCRCAEAFFLLSLGFAIGFNLVSQELYVLFEDLATLTGSDKAKAILRKLKEREDHRFRAH